MPIAPNLITLADRLKAQGAEKQDESLWKGPCDPGPHGGITQSGLNDFLSCRERFRVRWIEGWRTPDRWSHAMEYGTMFHLACEHHDQGQPWQEPTYGYAAKLCEKYPTDREDINKYYQALLVQFPVYLDYWSKHEATKPCKTHSREQSFNIPYELPSGRVVYLRGKSDGLDEVPGGLRLLEHKTKSGLDPMGIERRLSFDLQTALYAIALSIREKQPVIGVLYDVIKRPFSSGKGCIKRAEGRMLKGGWKEGESEEAFYGRVQWYFKTEPEEWFSRWEVTFGLQDLDNFRHKCLNPLLEGLVSWHDWVSTHSDPFDPAGHGIHWMAPFGLWSPLVEGGGTTDLDSYLLEGSSVGLHRADTLFRELV